MSFCNDVDGVMKFWGHDCEDEEWHLFTDASDTGVKSVLLM
jgi:hypothetical protein